MRTRSAQRLLCLAMAAAAAGCSSKVLDWMAAESAPPPRAPTGQITHSDVVALNEAVAVIARTENPRGYGEASTKLAKLLPRFEAAGEQAYAAETMFWLAYCYEKTGQKMEAAEFYDQIIRKYPQTRPAEEARLRRSRLEFKRPAE